MGVGGGGGEWCGGLELLQANTYRYLLIDLQGVQNSALVAPIRSSRMVVNGGRSIVSGLSPSEVTAAIDHLTLHGYCKVWV